MIGCLVVPGLPKRWVIPSDLSSSMKALRPLIVFDDETDVMMKLFARRLKLT
jgi:hypothetical protein